MRDRSGSSAGSTSLFLNALVERVKHRDDEALNQLLVRVEGRLRVLTHKMLAGFPKVRSQEETDDVLQQAMIRLVHALKKVELVDLAHFQRLAALQIRRELITMAQRHATPPNQVPLPAENLGSGADGELPIGGSTWTPANIAVWTDFHEQVEKLPAGERDVFDLVYYHGLSTSEAAEVLGYSDRLIRTRWRNARMILVEAMGDRLPGLS